MSRLSFWAGVLCMAVVGCSGSPNGDPSSNDENAITNAVGTVDIPLTAVNNGIQYQLAAARFTITGAALGKKPKVVIPPADEPVHTETLTVGSYSILLEDGWQLQAKGPGDLAFAPVDAALTTGNPLSFTISRDVATDVVFRFATAAGVVVAIDRGQVNIRIDVSDCSAYDQFTAALGTFTVDCLGTIGPDSYILDAAGYLRRNFDKCPLDDSKLQSINDLLGLQYRKQLLPIGKQCIEGRWTQWKRGFEKSGITQCPLWKKLRPITPPTQDMISKAIPQLPKPGPDPRDRPPIIQQLKEGAFYVVGFPTPPMQQCATPAACAAQCAGGFPGFVVGADGEAVVTDPAYWLLDTVFTPNPDPFLTPGYFHPMSYYGPVPGAIVGHRNRAPFGGEEACSYYASDGMHYLLRLKLNCMDVTDYVSCVSVCLP